MRVPQGEVRKVPNPPTKEAGEMLQRGKELRSCVVERVELFPGYSDWMHTTSRRSVKNDKKAVRAQWSSEVWKKAWTLALQNLLPTL